MRVLPRSSSPVIRYREEVRKNSKFARAPSSQKPQRCRSLKNTISLVVFTNGSPEQLLYTIDHICSVLKRHDSWPWKTNSLELSSKKQSHPSPPLQQNVVASSCVILQRLANGTLLLGNNSTFLGNQTTQRLPSICPIS